MSERLLIVADTGPLISLARIGQVEILRHLYDEVCIPPEVDTELARHRHELARSIVPDHPWLTIRPSATPLAAPYAARLDPGESDAIALALELKATLLIDERRGRLVAQELLGIPVRGTLGTLVAARRAGLVGPLEPLLQLLVADGDHFGAGLVEDTLRAVGER